MGDDVSVAADSRGIYNAANCCNVQNHAVLLTGYGTYALCCTVLLLYCTVLLLYCTVLYFYCTVLYCTVLYCTVLYFYCTVLLLYCTSTVLYCTVLYCTVLYCKVLFCAVFCAAHTSTVQYVLGVQDVSSVPISALIQCFRYVRKILLRRASAEILNALARTC
jgi:hypothetical protein